MGFSTIVSPQAAGCCSSVTGCFLEQTWGKPECAELLDATGPSVSQEAVGKHRSSGFLAMK